MKESFKEIKESFKEIYDQSYAMLLDRSKPEADLIYFISKLDDESRSAIILAYQYIYLKQD